MSYAIHMHSALAELMDALSTRARLCVRTKLERLAELAEHWPVGDPRWEQLARQDGEALLFYAEGCCVRLELRPEQRLLVVREMGRVLVRLPGSRAA
ncbi:hypothetical protein JY651_35905 [Pyxidicoccus parkwayensis]|jgi:CelD/BcsL family acetyltransferase involved in cellulose biosynthesis|uniref:Uncharacterized protein n=1 Tax=Pyxidicoccus parkwayensis TaxID=2813578 RepID=A0ABX7NP85_9BACT|nr:hypothetical protein [Pyxidicoccus parkwaysis]QSQ20585.1 hypothetical protein JY651_35905 [Pyxidicoccus parkwaysis]